MPLAVDPFGWLKTDTVGDPEIRHVPSKRNSRYREPPCNPDSLPMAWPIAHVMHTTDLVVAMAKLADRIVNDTPENDGASWHFGIGRDGVIHQSVPLVIRSRHASGGGVVEGRKVANVGRCTAGTELESPGRLRYDGSSSGAANDDKFYVYPYWRLGSIVAPDGKRRPDRSLGFDPAHLLPKRDPYGQPYVVVSDGAGAWWVEFTPQQVTAFEHLVRACASWRPVGLLAGAPPPLGHAGAWRYGHVDFPGTSGKEDPGKLWPKVRDAVLARVFVGAA